MKKALISIIAAIGLSANAQVQSTGGDIEEGWIGAVNGVGFQPIFNFSSYMNGLNWHNHLFIGTVYSTNTADIGGGIHDGLVISNYKDQFDNKVITAYENCADEYPMKFEHAFNGTVRFWDYPAGQLKTSTNGTIQVDTNKYVTSQEYKALEAKVAKLESNYVAQTKVLNSLIRMIPRR
jgi:hypothetical protein